MTCFRVWPMALLFLAWSAHFSALRAENPPIEVVPADHVRTYLERVFVSPEMQEAARQPGNIVYETIERLARHPLFVSTPSSHPASPANFTPYFRILTLRNYVDPMRGDLYHLHELVHMAYMTYDPDLSYEQWAQKLIENEKWASFVSEVLIHFHCPEIRARLRIERIWADDFLSESERARFAADPDAYTAELFEKFKSIGRGLFPAGNDILIRSWIYDRSNELYAAIFWAVAPEIERRMSSFYSLVGSEPDRAIREHLEWVDRVREDGMLYPRQTVEHFARFDRLNLIRFNPHASRAREDADQMALRLQGLADVNAVSSDHLAYRIEALSLGVSRTVYAIPFPETRELTEEVWRTQSFDALFGEPYLTHQDAMHGEFVGAYRNWAGPVVSGLEAFPHAHPAAGSAEAIKDVLAVIHGRLIANRQRAELHMFEGDYEGVVKYAEAMGLQVVKHPRTREHIENLKQFIKAGEYFYISEPSAIDGNLWPDFDRFMQVTQRLGARVLVDLAYVGTVARDYSINLNYPHIEAVFFSLSKSFGVYYQRIGGVLVREPNPLLQGNVWTKNLLSLKIGTRLMQKYPVHELPRRHLWAQQAAINAFNLSQDQIRIEPSDVLMLAHASLSGRKSVGIPALEAIVRGGVGDRHFRPNLTPAMIHFIEGSRDPWTLQMNRSWSEQGAWGCGQSIEAAATVLPKDPRTRSYGTGAKQ